ncbi:head fiber protein [Paenibacillus macerans]|uniref:head fiber protein n=1 Tax=Paenibacillus macerans TaxID=44252 RepID=UPI002DBD36C5|nr:head fiber protein [Paenibacillus macerans]MEC0139730.1 head fiber protein [Paenibacillus macerans]
MTYQLNEKRSPEYVRIVPASDAVAIPPKREPKYVVFIDENGVPIDIGGGGTVAVAWADITGKPTTFTPPAATTSAIGGVKKMATQANSAATDVTGLVADFNALLAKMKSAGLM